VALELSAPAEQDHVRKLRVLKQAAQVFGQPTVRNLHLNYHSIEKNFERQVQVTRSLSDPDWISSVDPYPDPDSESGSKSRRAKITQKNRKKVKKFHVLKCWMFSFDGLKAFCSL
jgi:hypothetical protein